MASDRKRRQAWAVTATRLVRACQGKATYPSRKNARGKARAVATLINEAMDAYQCPKCRGWHIGHRFTVRNRMQR